MVHIKRWIGLILILFLTCHVFILSS